MTQLSQTIAQDLKLSSKKVQAALDLFDTGATVPFVARYRKEATGGLDEVQLRAILDRKGYFTDLEQRRKTILQAIGEQGELTSDLERRIRDASSKTALEDLYAPFKKRRKTRADTAREKGLAPLAERMLAQPRDGHPVQEARRFVHPARGIASVDEALAGARDIVAETLGLDATLRTVVRDAVQQHGVLRSKLAKKGLESGQFRDYVDYQERGQRVPSSDTAVCRGEEEDYLSLRRMSTAAAVCGAVSTSNSPFGPNVRSVKMP